MPPIPSSPLGDRWRLRFPARSKSPGPFSPINFPSRPVKSAVVTLANAVQIPNHPRLLVTGKTIGTASVSCEYQTGSGTDFITFSVTVQQDVERVNKILADHNDSSTVITAKLSGSKVAHHPRGYGRYAFRGSTNLESPSERRSPRRSNRLQDQIPPLPMLLF